MNMVAARCEKHEATRPYVAQTADLQGHDVIEQARTLAQGAEANDVSFSLRSE
jgi:hypothetical protein